MSKLLKPKHIIDYLDKNKNCSVKINYTGQSYHVYTYIQFTLIRGDVNYSLF